MRDVTLEMAREALPGLPVKYQARQLSDPYDIQQARQLSTKKFVNLGKYTPQAVTPEGLPRHDDYLPISTFFASFDTANDDMLAAVRLLWSETATVDDLRTPVELLDEDKQELLLGQQPGNVAEIGSLAKKSGVSQLVTLKVLRELFAFGNQHDIKYFVCGLEPKVLPTYERLFGGAITRLVEDTIEFPGVVGPQVPLLMEPKRAFGKQRQEMRQRSLGGKALGFGVRHFFKSTIPTIE